MSLAFTCPNGPLLCMSGAQFLALHESSTLGVLVRADPWEGDDELQDQREDKGREKRRKKMSSLILC